MKNLKDFITESNKDYFQALCELDTSDFEKVIKKVKTDRNIKPYLTKELDIMIDDVVWMMQDVCDQHEGNDEITDTYGNDWLFKYVYVIMKELEVATDGEMLTISDSIAKNLKKLMK